MNQNPSTDTYITETPAAGRREVERVSDYDEMNEVLFVRRDEIRATVAELEAELDKMGESRLITKRLNRAMRELDEITATIVDANYGLVCAYVSRFTKNASHADRQDYEAAGRVGLLRAIDNYDHTRGRFSSWCYKPIQREVLKEVHRAEFGTLRPVDFERRPHVLRAQQALNASMEERPTVEDIAALTGYTPEQVAAVLDAASVDSLQRPVGDDGAVMGDLLADPTGDFADDLTSMQFVEALGAYGIPCLSEREVMVLVRRFGLDSEPAENLASIGDLLGLSREAIRQIETRAIAKVNHPILLRKVLAHCN